MSLLLVRSSSSRRSSALRRGFASLIQPRDQAVAVEQDTRREIECVTERLRADIAKNDQPVLMKAAEYFFQKGKEGKRFRSTVVLLMSTALSQHGPLQSQLEVDTSPAAEHPQDLRRRQQRIAEIAELIHVASYVMMLPIESYWPLVDSQFHSRRALPLFQAVARRRHR